MDIFSVTQKGSFDNTEKFLGKFRVVNNDIRPLLEKYGPIGVRALSEATPHDSGLTAGSWYYDIVERPGYISLRFYNSNVQNGIPIAILIQYGHGTRNGGWVEGQDYIMPVIQPIFDKIMEEVIK